ncbi:Scarecrow-like protein [Trichinella pseudospiralis]
MNSQASPDCNRDGPQSIRVRYGQPLISIPTLCYTSATSRFPCFHLSRIWCLDNVRSVCLAMFALFPGSPWRIDRLRLFFPRLDLQSLRIQALAQLRVA